MTVIATLNRKIGLDDMVLCCFNIRPKLKYKHICNFINERHGVPLTMRRLLLPWLITTSCLISQFQISGRKSETLGQLPWYPAEGLSLNLKTSLQILGRCSWNQISGRGFHKIWSLNKLGRRKPILSIKIGRLLHHVWYLTFRCPAAHLKLSAKDLDIPPRVWVWIWRLVYISWADVLGFWYPAEVFIKFSPWIN